jgi:hypothetical protein
MMQKHMFGVTCPDELFIKTAPGPTEHENSALMFRTSNTPEDTT